MPEIKPASKIIGIQFSILSPEEIRKQSVVEVTSRDTYINNKPVIGGLFDPRMGVLEPGTVCPTDGMSYIDTPGYFGHIELARPVFFIQHIKEIIKISRCICFKCSKLLMNKHQHKHVLELRPEHRWEYVFAQASKAKRCGEQTEDGCGCKQPDKIKHEGMANIFAIWEDMGNNVDKTKQKVTIKMTPEIVLKLFQRISDEDVHFMGFSPVFSHPAWMVCTVLPIAPPAVRPSVKHDAQQRSEDDLTHIYSNIIKTNNFLKDKLAAGTDVNASAVEMSTEILQHSVAMIANNKIKGVAPMAQRSGRPLQCIMGRINSKNGRIRGNLMGKRVDFSARSVITGDPNLSVRQLGVPMKIARNITKPVMVNDRNREFLMQLVQTGPDTWPGAKILERRNGVNVSLRYIDRTHLVLENGDIVHRHMMDGDMVLFNRQPSLHRMSMMGHIVKVMPVGDTFRMNVAATKSYNADFDGDEMNMHMPQSIMAETELRHLAAIPHQLISPTSNTPIIGIFQDSLLGAYRLTRPNITFSRAEAMRLLCRYDHVDLDALEACFQKSERITSFQLLSQIFPRMSMKYETKLFDADRPEDQDKATSNNVFEIVNGEYRRGQLEKGVLGSGTKGVLHRITNDFGETASADFNDNLQNIVTEYMKTSSFSVGMSDLMADKITEESIGKILEKQKVEVQHVIDRVHLGIFENETAHSNLVEFETQVNNILNEATNVAGNIGHKSLSRDNRFAMIVESGSKGNRTNITQMISCLGQQNVDGKRIPYGFDSRTLPHYTKYDDSPAARGFVENSYISGLTAPELFFHAMGGRIGLIDTAVKSVTGDTKIVVVVDGEPLVTEIGEWIDRQMAEKVSTVRRQEEKNMELLDVDDVVIPTVNEEGEVTWEAVTVVTRHDPGERLYKVTTRSGRKVTVAESQSLLVWDASKKQFLPKNSPDVHVGECVPVTIELRDYSDNSESVLYTSEDIAMCIQHMSNDDYVPPKAFISESMFIERLLTRYYSLFGYMDKHVLCIRSTSPELLDGIAMLFSRIGIFAEIKHDTICLSGEHGRNFGIMTNMVLSNGSSLIENKWESDRIYVQHNDVVLDPIVKIEVLGTEAYPKLYDLTIPSTLNFCLANGLGVRDTSSTGYVQRRLIKGLEDLKVEYDMTVRNSKGKIIQFAYGEDGFDSTKVESQVLPLVEMSVNDIYQHFDTSDDAMLTAEAKKRAKGQQSALKNKAQETVELLIEKRDDLVTKVFKCRREKSVVLPVNFQYLIQTIQGQLGLGKHSTVDITPMEMLELVEEYWTRLNASPYVRTNPLLECMYRYHLSPRDMLTVRRFHRQGLVLLLETVLLKFKEAVVHPGEMVGVVAGQGCGEPSTQLTLNSFVYETDILVRHIQTKEIEKIQIGEFMHREEARAKKIDYMAEKDTTYAELSTEYEVPSATEDGETVWRRIEAVTRHPVVNEDGTDTMLKVTTKGGREIIATKAKSFLQLMDGKIQGVNGSELRVGDYVPVAIKPLSYTENFTLALRSVLPPTEFIYGTEMEKARSVMHEHCWWKNHAGKTFTLPYSRSDSVVVALNDSRKDRPRQVCYQPGFVYTKSNTICNYLVPEVIDLDYDFGYLMGAYCAEGCTTKFQMSIANNDPAYFAPIMRLCDKYNVTYKMYTQANKTQEGWTSSDMRIYSSILTRTCATLGGKLSHLKYVSPHVVFSNRQCQLGFLDAYISGDGCVSQHKNVAGEYLPTSIIMSSTSRCMLTDVSVMLRNLGVSAAIFKTTTKLSNNRGTLPENIHQMWRLEVTNHQAQILASMLNLTIAHKQEKLQNIISRTPKHQYSKFHDTVFPNCVNGKIVFEDRRGRMPDLQFDEVVSIEEMPNTTPYAYDLTVEETRNFDCYNGLAVKDTFHSSGIGSKSNVTRGVPRIEEILRLTKNPKASSMTVYLHPYEEDDKDRAALYATTMQHTKLVDVVKHVQICFDPDESNTNLLEDRLLLEQFYEFERTLQTCTDADDAAAAAPKRSKWIVRMEFDSETLLERGLTMDDIHQAIAQSQYGQDAHCVFSDYNMDNLVFRIRMNGSVFNKNKKKVPEPLDQSDEIYLLKNFQDQLLKNVVLRGVGGIRNVQVRKVQNQVTKNEGTFVPKEAWCLDTTGSNLIAMLGLSYVDPTRTFTNNIREIFHVLGIEAARQSILNELNEVMEFSGGVYINYHHTSLLCDRMTCNKDMVSIFRSGLLNDDTGPIAKASFEVHTEVLLDAARHADVDHMRGVSASIMCGQYGSYGTGAFNLVLDTKAMEKLPSARIGSAPSDLDTVFVNSSTTCRKDTMAIKTHLDQTVVLAPVCDDDYDAGF